MRGRFWRLQYEGLHELCFTCGKFGHRQVHCSLGKKTPDAGVGVEQEPHSSGVNQESQRSGKQTVEEPGFGPWTVVHRGGRRGAKPSAGKTNIPPSTSTAKERFVKSNRGVHSISPVAPTVGVNCQGPKAVAEPAASGSRFSPLDAEGDIEVEVDEDMVGSDLQEGVNVSSVQPEVAVEGSCQDSLMSEGTEGVFHFSASHESIKQTIKPLRRPSELEVGEGSRGGKKKSRVLKDISNMSEPAHSKPSWVKPNSHLSSGGPVGEQVGAQGGPNTVQLDVGSDATAGPTSSVHSVPLQVGSGLTRPPDPYPPYLGHEDLGKASIEDSFPKEVGSGGDGISSSLDEEADGVRRQDGSSGA